MKTRDDKELRSALDYILNRAQMREIDALEAAVTRRRKALERQTGVISLDPERAAKEMTGAVQESLRRGMEGVKDTFRSFAFDLLDREAPDLPEEEKEKLVEAWIPKSAARSEVADAADFPGVCSGLAENGKIGGLPVDAFAAMVRQFVAYSTGTLPVQEEAELRDTIADWPAVYWRKFPPEVQKRIKAFLSGECTEKEFNAALAALLRHT